MQGRGLFLHHAIRRARTVSCSLRSCRQPTVSFPAIEK
jgi:hypothetical protein